MFRSLTSRLFRWSVRYRRVLPFVIIMAAVLAWGAFHALGAFATGHDWRKPLIVLGFFLAFLSFWCAMLWSARKRKSTAAPKE